MKDRQNGGILFTTIQNAYTFDDRISIKRPETPIPDKDKDLFNFLFCSFTEGNASNRPNTSKFNGLKNINILNSLYVKSSASKPINNNPSILEANAKYEPLSKSTFKKIRQYSTTDLAICLFGK